MRYVYFALSALTTFFLVKTLNNPLTLSGKTLPALGMFFSPFDGFWHNAESVKSLDTDLQLSGVTKPVKIVFDDRDVPHIFAETTADALFAQGYLHAKNRLWEMEFISHVSAGRISELVGNQKLGKSTTIETDKILRRRGIANAAEKLAAFWAKDVENFKLIEAYCNGANAFISELASKDFPVEYKILGVAPEKFSPYKVALIFKYLCIDLASGDKDFEATNAKTLLGGDFDSVFPEYFKEQSPIVPTGTPFNFKPVTNPKSEGLSTLNENSNRNPLPTLHSELSTEYIIPKELAFAEQYAPDENNGSNNWAIAPSKTKNKKPILCGDPHLSLRLPSVWYEQQIVSPDVNVYGVTFPGIPLILIGFNKDIAWTVTNVGHDVADWYKMTWTDTQKTQYLLDGATKAADLKIEKIFIKGVKDPIVDTVRYTFWGPVVYFGSNNGNSDLAYKWMANEKPELDLNYLFGLSKAKNYDDYRVALNHGNAPAQNVAFACSNGDIALTCMGAFPIKRKEQGRFVQDGSVSANNWQGIIPKDQVPQYKNPSRGFVSSANQHSTDPAYPYYYNSETFEAFRGRIINDTLSKMKDITVDEMKGLQNDNFSLLAKESLPALIKNVEETQLNPAEQAILQQLKNWHYYFDADSAEPVYFLSWFNAAHAAIWDEVTKSKNAAFTLSPSLWRTTALLRNEPNSKFFDIVETTDKKETERDIVTAAFHTMSADIEAKQAEVTVNYPKSPTLTWSKVKDTEIPHLSGIPGFGRKHINTGGQDKCINAIKKDNGPSWRMVVELDSVPHAWVVYPGGQSGNPGSKNFDNFVDTWAKGEYYEAIYMRSPTETNKRIVSIQTISQKKDSK